MHLLNQFANDIKESQYIIMLKQQSSQPLPEDPFANIFEDGMEEFVLYQKQIPKQHISRAQRHKEKIEKMERDLNDVELKRQRNAKRRNAQKSKVHRIIETLNQEELKVFIEGRKKKKKDQKEKVRNAMPTGQVFMIDLVYEAKMNGKENKSLGKQIELIMKGIKHLNSPPSIHLCSFQGDVQFQLEKMGYEYWPLTTHLQNIAAVGQKLGKKLIYLSPDAELPLEKVESDTGYILGGLIDRTILKYASLMRAKGLNIEARKLPIRQFMRSRIVLNLDHVVLMVCKFKECNDWKEAFDYAAPKRYKRDAYQNEEKGKEESESEEEEVLEKKQENDCEQNEESSQENTQQQL